MAGPIGAGRKGKTLSRIRLLCSALGLGLPLLGCRKIGPSWVILGPKFGIGPRPPQHTTNTIRIPQIKINTVV